MQITKIADSFIEFSFYCLFFLVPLIWLPITSELFEFNKIILVYLLTTVIITAWVVKIITEKKLVIKRTPLDIPILIFLGANFLSTVFSIDPQTSIFGYYGRFNGGLLSILSYSLLYFALVNNSTVGQIVNYLYTTLASSLIAAVYGVLQHPNPLFQEKVAGQTIFHGIDHDYWAVDAEARVFSTLGQPNWLAAFLAMTIFPLTALLFILKKFWQKLVAFLVIIVTYLAFTFTYSRGGTLGLLAGIGTFVILLPTYKRSWLEKLVTFPSVIARSLRRSNLLRLPRFARNDVVIWISCLIIGFLIVNFYFGNALSNRTSLPQIAPQAKPTTQQAIVHQTQLEVQGKETAQIRFIVWKGAVEIFKHFPIFGSGVETFGYSYYLYRPVEHNLVSEWDYIYNKAHNEFANYLATTGAVGFISYLLLIGAFELVAIRLIWRSQASGPKLLAIGLVAAYNSYLIQNIFGFSVVPIALLFFLYPGFFILLTGSTGKTLSFDLVKKANFLKNDFSNKFSQGFVVVIGLLIFGAVLSMWLADFYYSRSAGEAGYEKTISYLRLSSKLNAFEPLYKADLAVNLAGLASTTQNASEQRAAKTEARTIIKSLVAAHPNNLSLWKTKRIIDFNLAKIDKASELDLLATAERLKKLAPTDASTQYDIALVYSYVQKPTDAEKQLEKVLKLKPDYQEAVITLAQTYQSNKKIELAKKLLQDWLKKNPADIDAENLLKTLMAS